MKLYTVLSCSIQPEDVHKERESQSQKSKGDNIRDIISCAKCTRGNLIYSSSFIVLNTGGRTYIDQVSVYLQT